MAEGYPFTIVDYLGSGSFGTVFLVETELSPDGYAALKLQRENNNITAKEAKLCHTYADPYEINAHECRVLRMLEGLPQVSELYAEFSELEATIEELGIDALGMGEADIFTERNDTHRFYGGYVMEYKEGLEHVHPNDLTPEQKEKLARFITTAYHRGVTAAHDLEKNLFAQGPSDIVVVDWHHAQLVQELGFISRGVYRKNPLHDFSWLEERK